GRAAVRRHRDRPQVPRPRRRHRPGSVGSGTAGRDRRRSGHLPGRWPSICDHSGGRRRPFRRRIGPARAGPEPIYDLRPARRRGARRELMRIAAISVLASLALATPLAASAQEEDLTVVPPVPADYRPALTSWGE